MSVKASEISELIKDRIKNFEANAEARDVGTVVSLTDGIVRIYGTCAPGQLRPIAAGCRRAAWR